MKEIDFRELLKNEIKKFRSEFNADPEDFKLMDDVGESSHFFEESKERFNLTSSNSSGFCLFWTYMKEFSGLHAQRTIKQQKQSYK